MRKIFIWGTGRFADQIVKNGVHAEIAGYIETHKTKECFQGRRVFLCTEVVDEYEAIIVISRHSNEIYIEAKRHKVDLEKMIFFFPCTYIETADKLDWIKEILGANNFEIYCAMQGLYENTFFARDKECYSRLNRRETFQIDEMNLRPITRDRYSDAGTISSYFWQDLWAARLIHDNCPKEHFDIGSRLDGFIAHILSMGISVNMIDIRPFPTEIQGLKTVVADATLLEQLADGSIESLSALCSLEHFGLGRYGDPIDPEACFKCFDSIQRKLKPGGKVYISVPVGKERLEFNAHRIFYAKTIVTCFDKMKLLEYSCTANGKIERNVELERYDNDIICRGSRFGLFYFEKI